MSFLINTYYYNERKNNNMNLNPMLYAVFLKVLLQKI